jgi:hypothetical protein
VRGIRLGREKYTDKIVAKTGFEVSPGIISDSFGDKVVAFGEVLLECLYTC